MDTIKQELALEKMARTSAEADLDAVKNKKPDTSEADSLRKELESLKEEHQQAIEAAKQEANKLVDDRLATMAALEKKQAETDNVQAELDKQKAEAESQAKTSKADYQDLHDSLGQLVEEANKKAADLEARLKEAEAVVKVKDAELKESQVRSQSRSATKCSILTHVYLG